jgi:F0F1-type ATP synthase assembly protein I
MKQSDQNDGNKSLSFSMALASVLGMGGLVTLGIVILALLGGLWLDRTMNTRPLFTLLLMIASAPISIFVMYRVAMNSISKMAPPAKKTEGDTQDQ